MEVRIGVAKINKYASSESGDTLEVVERPGGGLSVVLADGQRSGKSAKRISNLVVRKVISLLAEGVRDGAAARAASDYLYNERQGQVLATLNILSIDLISRTLVLSRNNHAPILIARKKKIECLDGESQPVGIYRNTRPEINQIPLEAGLTVVVYTDGLVHAGVRSGKEMDVIECLETMLSESHTPQSIADGLVQKALELDQGRPADDISVVVLSVIPRQGDDVRRMSLRLPIS